MKLSKSLSLVLIATQFSMGTMIASADQAPAASAQSPEFSLVESAVALQAMKLSPTDLQIRENAALTAYLAKAKTAGSQDRLAQALVSLGIYSQAQAQAFVADAQAASAKLTSANLSAPMQARAAIESEVTQLAALHPAGAQFSASKADLNCAGGVASLVGIATVLTGLIVAYDNPTCSAPQWDATTCGPDGCYDTTVTGPTTCTAPDYYPHQQTGDDIMIGGGIVLGVGALMYFLSGGFDGANCN